MICMLLYLKSAMIIPTCRRLSVEFFGMDYLVLKVMGTFGWTQFVLRSPCGSLRVVLSGILHCDGLFYPRELLSRCTTISTRDDTRHIERR